MECRLRPQLDFEAAPHFFPLRPDGAPVAEMQGVVPRDSLDRVLNRLLTAARR